MVIRVDGELVFIFTCRICSSEGPLDSKYSSPSILRPSILRPPVIILLDVVTKGNFPCKLPYFKTTGNIRTHFLGPMCGLKIVRLLMANFNRGCLLLYG